jgi:hypothetical protein
VLHPEESIIASVDANQPIAMDLPHRAQNKIVSLYSRYLLALVLVACFAHGGNTVAAD